MAERADPEKLGLIGPGTPADVTHISFHTAESYADALIEAAMEMRDQVVFGRLSGIPRVFADSATWELIKTVDLYRRAAAGRQQ